MSEQFEGEKGPSLEELEKQRYKEFQDATEEEVRIMREIDKVFADTPGRAKAEEIVLEKWASLMDEAEKKSSEAYKAWSNAMTEANERERKELDDMEKGWRE